MFVTIDSNQKRKLGVIADCETLLHIHQGYRTFTSKKVLKLNVVYSDLPVDSPSAPPRKCPVLWFPETMALKR